MAANRFPINLLGLPLVPRPLILHFHRPPKTINLCLLARIRHFHSDEIGVSKKPEKITNPRVKGTGNACEGPSRSRFCGLLSSFALIDMFRLCPTFPLCALCFDLWHPSCLAHSHHSRSAFSQKGLFPSLHISSRAETSSWYVLLLH